MTSVLSSPARKWPSTSTLSDEKNAKFTLIDTISSTVTDNAEYTANWTPITYTIEYNLNGGIASENPVTYNIETDDITLNNPSKEGYTFIGWTFTNYTVVNRNNAANQWTVKKYNGSSLVSTLTFGDGTTSSAINVDIDISSEQKLF